MAILKTIWILAQVLIGFNLVFPLLLAGLNVMLRLIHPQKRSYTSMADQADYGIIVTAYEQTAQLPAVVASILTMNYERCIIYIVADKCDISDLHFDSEKVMLLRPETPLASNTGSHFYAIDRFIRPHQRLTIVDSDNLVHPEYLNELNKQFDKGYIAVQGVREAKNLDTMYACLDAARDKYYHYYDGKMLFGAGASATLAGSGMAFTTELYKACLGGMIIDGPGFDKVLQYEILKRGHRIAFAPEALVYDEKTSRPEQLVNQRARWIQSWFRYFKYGFGLIGKGIARLSWNQLLFGIVLLRPPLFMFLLAGILALIIDLFISPITAGIWAIGFGLFIVGFMIALMSSRTDQRIYRSLSGIPRFITLQMLSLIRARHAGKYSVATKHDGILNSELKKSL